MELRGFHHVAIQVHALEHVAAFYRDILGLPEEVRHRRPDGTLRSIWLTIPGGFLAFEEVEHPPLAEPFRHPTPGLHLLAFRIDRAARAQIVAELARHGIPLEHQTKWTLYVRDPEGNRVGLSHHPD